MQMPMAIQKLRLQHLLPFPAFAPAHVVEWHIRTPLLLEEHMAPAGLIMADGSGVTAVEVRQTPADFSEWLPQMRFIIMQGEIILRRTKSRDIHSYPIFITWKNSIKPKTFTHPQLFLILTGHR